MSSPRSRAAQQSSVVAVVGRHDRRDLHAVGAARLAREHLGAPCREALRRQADLPARPRARRSGSEDSTEATIS